MNIILIGFMGAGKSAVGQLLAKELKMNFLDTDELIERTENRKISEIFKAEGEAYFRQVETETLKTLQDYDNFVLSTGGGIVLKEENVQLLKSLGKNIFLWAEPEVIYQRIKNEAHRPLLDVTDPKAEIIRILEVRQPIYEKVADHKINTSAAPVDQVVKEIIEWLKSRSN